MNENGGGGVANGGSGNAAVVANGNGYSSNVEQPAVRLHDANGCQKVFTAGTAEEEWCEKAVSGGGGGGKGRKTSSPVVSELKLLVPPTTGTGQRELTTMAAEENKENVIVVGGGGLVSRSLFPDAPTTPKVSRKALPVEPLLDGHLYPHHHHHHHHHHHNNNNNNNQYQHQSQHHLSFAPAHHVFNHNHHHHQQLHTAGCSVASVSCSPSTCVKKHVQKMRIQSPVAQLDSSNSSEEMATVTTPSKPYVGGGDARCSELSTSPGTVDPDGVSDGSIGILTTLTDTMNHVAVPDEAAPASLPCSHESTSFGTAASVTSTTVSSSSCSSAHCTLKCIETSTVSSGGVADNSVHVAATNGHSKVLLQPNDKDAIIC
uniref:Uncharacterized protein n=1 Tax=Anopheles maculatus TaxID=74869 RepID=A0A182SRL3_9DIPT